MSTTQPSSNKPCPSDFVLDRKHAGEPVEWDVEPLDEHLSTCASCQARMQERQLGFVAFGGTEQAYLARFRQRLDQERQTSAAPASTDWRSKLKGALIPKLLVGAVAVTGMGLLIVRRPGSLGPSADSAKVAGGVRRKGSSALTVFVSRNGEVHTLAEGDTLREGDRLRFGVTLDKARQVMVVGQENDGALYDIAVNANGWSIRLDAGHQQVLPHSVQLDDSTGHEVIHLVSCPEAFERTALEPASANVLSAPEECEVTSLHVRKASDERGP